MPPSVLGQPSGMRQLSNSSLKHRNMKDRWFRSSISHCTNKSKIEFCLDIDNVVIDEFHDQPDITSRVPILGPTRQDTEIYFQMISIKHEQHRKGCKTVSTVEDNIEQSHPPPRTAPSSFPPLWDSDSHRRISRADVSNCKQTNNHDCSDDTKSDIYLFRDMIRSIDYKMAKRREKVLVPSKHGYHPRSHSPTFRRLVTAAEKLSGLLGSLSKMTNDSEKEIMNIKTLTPFDESNADKNITFDKDHTGISGHMTKKHLRTEPHNPILKRRTQREFLPSETKGDQATPDSSKVSLKAGESHTELHLFLPHLTRSVGTDHSKPTTTSQTKGFVDSCTGRNGEMLPAIRDKKRHSGGSKVRTVTSKKPKSNGRRSISPTKPVTKERQDKFLKRRNYEEIEPYVKGESLKERLDDFPTLISLDTKRSKD